MSTIAFVWLLTFVSPRTGFPVPIGVFGSDIGCQYMRIQIINGKRLKFEADDKLECVKTEVIP